MPRSVNRTLLALVALIVFTDLSAQDKKNQTLLWRIHKAGKAPSFLFGTMHVSDKKAFNFRDSLYTYLEQAEAFALEFNPDSANQIIEAYLSGELVKEQEPTDFFDGDSEPPPSFMPTPDLDSALAIAEADGEGPKFTKKEQPGFIDLFVERLVTNQQKQSASMNTFMDAFLYEIAWQQGKKIYGLERMEGKAEVIRALSEGLKPKKIGSLLHRWNPAEDESPINRYYLREEIDSLDHFYSEYFTESSLDIFLYNRNEVMADRMDSIMQEQTLFAAVGAGHLAGRKGIIERLRRKGYVVEPVFSSNRVPADQYQFKLTERTWHVERSMDYGFQFKLPGLAKSQDGTKGRKMVYHYDLGGGTLFMTMYGRLFPNEKKKSMQEIVTAHLDEMLSAEGGRVLSRKTITVDSVPAIEAICLFNDNTYYRYREWVRDNVFYVLSVGSEKKDNLTGEKAEAYFQSFRALPIPVTRWTAFSSPEDGFSVQLPGKPVSEDVPVEKESAGMVTMRSYSYFDANTGVDYFITSGKALAGNQYLEGESFFENYVEHVRQLSGDQPEFSDTTFNGYPCKTFTAKTAHSLLKGFVVKRANTSYYLVADYEPGQIAEMEADRFLQSFKIAGFEKPRWSLQQPPSGEFRAWLPADIRERLQDTTAYNYVPGEFQYYGYDPFAAMSYNVEVYPVSPYYWASNLDSIYSHWQQKVVNEWSDTLLSSGPAKNAGLSGREIVLMKRSTGDKKTIRLLLNGSKMYVLVCPMARTHGDEQNARRFLNEFVLETEETASAILQNSPQKLFSDLQSNDSATFQKAYNALDDVSFSKEHILLLMEKATLLYPSYEGNYRTVNNKLLAEVEQIVEKNGQDMRGQVTGFIRENFTKENKAIDSVRFSLLAMIAAGKTQDDYRVLKELLDTRKHGADYPYQFFGRLYDSLELARSLYPGLLNHIDDSTMNFAIISLTKRMIDSSQLSAEILIPVKQDLLGLAKKQLKEFNKDDYPSVYELPDLVDLLSYLKQKEADDLVARFVKTKNNWIRQAAALALIRNGKPVSSSVLRGIAQDQEYRVGFFESLKKLEKEMLFPAEFATQVGLAEGYVFNAIYDEEEDYSRPELVFIKKVNYTYKDEQKVFYIFRANYEVEPGEDEETDSLALETPIATTESYFAVAGPFDTDGSKLEIDEKENISGMWYDDKFDGMKNDYFFRKYIERWLKWQEDQKK